jgi:DNA-binding NarL/FixJ family response regulator
VAIVRTLVVTVPPLLADLVKTVLHPRLVLDVLGVEQSRDQALDRLRSLSPDLVLLGLDSGESDATGQTLLAALPSATVLVLAANGEHAWIYEMRPRRTAFKQVSVPSLARAVASRFERSAPRRRRADCRNR